MSDWKKYKEALTEDISESVHRYFAPVVGLIHGAMETISPQSSESDKRSEDSSSKKELSR